VLRAGVRGDESVTGDWVDVPVERLFADVQALGLFARQGYEVARWGPGGRPWSVAVCAGRILASMKPRDRTVITKSVIEGRRYSEVAVGLGVSGNRVGQIPARAIRAAHRRFGDLAAELVGPALDQLERMGGAATGWDVGDLTGEVSAGDVVLALRVSGEGRYRVAEGCVTRLTLTETRRLVPRTARR
jgi:hypothetical protein